MQYISYYRKYRPRTFKDVVGQEIIINILKNSVISKKISHAYIFSGPRGTGKTSLAKIFARAVNCLNPNNGDLCEECEACKNTMHNELDIIEIDAASNNGVDEIREIRNNVKLLPSSIKYKVYIIDEVHMLSISAFNALLKTLEEPPEHVIFILATTELYKIPATVLSRCQKFDFKSIPVSKISERIKYILELENKYLPDDVIDLISVLSNGGLRDAINLTDQVVSLNEDNITVDTVYNLIGNTSDEIIFELIRNILNYEIKGGLKIINNLFNDGKNLSTICDRLLIILRDILINNSSNDYFDRNYCEKLSEFEKVDANDVSKLSVLIFELESKLKKTTNKKTLFEIYFLKMIGTLKNSEKEVEMVKKDTNVLADLTEEKSDNYIEKVDVSYKFQRINNTLANADKSLKVKFLENFNKINDYISSKDYNAIANLLLKSTPEVISDKNIIFTFKQSFEVYLFDNNIEEIQKFLNKIYDYNYAIVAITEEEWIEIKKKYINDIKNGVKYEYIPEKNNNVKKNNKKITKLEKTIGNMFGDDIITIK